MTKIKKVVKKKNKGLGGFFTERSEDNKPSKIASTVNSWIANRRRANEKSLDGAYKINPNYKRPTKSKPNRKGSMSDDIANLNKPKVKSKTPVYTKTQIKNPLGNVKNKPKVKSKTKLPTHVAVIKTKPKVKTAIKPVVKSVKPKVKAVAKSKVKINKSDWRKKNYSEELKAHQLKMYNAGAFGNISKEKAVDGLPGKLTRAATAKYRSSNKGNIKKVASKKLVLKPNKPIIKKKVIIKKNKPTKKVVSAKQHNSLSAKQAMDMYKRNRNKKGL